jgi:hypothetical protein
MVSDLNADHKYSSWCGSVLVGVTGRTGRGRVWCACWRCCAGWGCWASSGIFGRARRLICCSDRLSGIC